MNTRKVDREPRGRTVKTPRCAHLSFVIAMALGAAGVAAPGPGSATPATAKAADTTPTERDRQLKAAAQDATIVKQGREVFTALCQACHGGEAAQGDAVSNLFDARWHHGDTPAQIERTILTGILDKGMPGWGEILPAEDTTALTAYLLSAQK